uniref:Uncharacterized protein n=1 Tax=Anguilla anguilla TaxID=7936 RepID=A0A0E9PD26_ANGAN
MLSSQSECEYSACKLSNLCECEYSVCNN